MELPKNITQIGEANKDCKIYVEDYVVSYMKQLNHLAQDKEVTVAVYGKRQTEDGISYYFLYGACRAESLQREARHLSQAQLQEIERLRRKYFSGLEFIGYRILNGEMIEGMHICEQGICRYIGGYARFYEKNDAMLSYMLAVREQAEPEKVDQSKYEEVKKRQDERRSTVNNAKPDAGQPVEWLKGKVPPTANLQKMRLAAVGGFALLCLLGIGTFREQELTGQVNDKDVAASAAAKQGMEQKETLKMEDKLEQALLAENQSSEAETDEETVPSQEEIPERDAVLPTENEAENMTLTSSETVQESQETPENVETSQTGQGAVAYIIQPGDTLIQICLRQYGNDVRVADVCSMNDISNPDDIKEGQIILLPD